jgi:hypothetical protein
MLYTVVMRYLCLSGDKPEERLFLQEPFDPFASEIELTDTSDAFGWLVWGKTIEVCRMTGPEEDAYCMDESCREGVEVIKEIMTAPDFWQTVSAAVLTLLITVGQLLGTRRRSDTSFRCKHRCSYCFCSTLWSSHFRLDQTYRRRLPRRDGFD